jgi:hypothetical protein
MALLNVAGPDTLESRGELGMNHSKSEPTGDPGDEVLKSCAPAESPPARSAKERERAEKVIQLLDEWMADESGHDEEMWPKLKAVLE